MDLRESLDWLDALEPLEMMDFLDCLESLVMLEPRVRLVCLDYLV